MAQELFKYPLLILLLVLANGIVHSIARGLGYSDWYDRGSDDNLACLSPWDVDQLPQEPRGDFYRDLRSCLRVLTPKCNRELYHYVFRKQRMCESCCQKLVQMGRGCKDSLAWTLIHTDKYERYEGHIRERSEDAFNMCSSASVRDYGSGWY